MTGQVMKLFHASKQMLRRSCLLLLTLGVAQWSLAQKIVRDSSGTKIIQYEDGTWRYFEGRDSMLESDLWEEINIMDSAERMVAGSAPTGQKLVYDYLLFQKYIAAAVRYEADVLDKVDESSNAVDTVEDRLRSLEASGDQAEADRLRSELVTLNARRQNDQRLLSYARSLIKKILKVGKTEKYQRLAKIYVPGFNVEKESNEYLNVKIASNEDRAMPGEMEPGISGEGDPIEDDRAPEKEPIFLITNDPDSDLQRLADQNTDGEITGILGVQVPEPPSTSGQPVKEEMEQKTFNDHEGTSPEPDRAPEKEVSTINELKGENQRATPVFTASTGDTWFSRGGQIPEYQCRFAFNGIDAFTNKQKKELQQELFFSFTDERLKPYLKDRDYVTCHGYLTSISGGFRYLTLVFAIASKNANREYGYIKNGSLLNLKLLDGQTVSLFTQSENQGIPDPKTGDMVYRVRYPVDFQKEKTLLKSGIERVRVVWSTGYEDYEVYNVDFFINQLNCLNSK
jgi:hypothetical protein